MGNRSLENILSRKRLLFYGIGNQFKECYKLFQNKEIFLFDSNPQKWGTTIGDLAIRSPQEMHQCINDDSCVIITTIYNQHEIAKLLVETMGVSSDKLFMYTSEWYETNIYKPEVIRANKEKVIAYSKRLGDKESQDYYWNAFCAREQRSPLLLMPNPNCLVKGDYGNTVCLKKGDVIIDCGAYTGDTAEMYMHKLENECKIYAIEPYKENYEKLSCFANALGKDRVETFNCAVGKKLNNTFIQYDNADFAMAINLSNRKGLTNQPIVIETIDHLFEGKKISYIKMDIEGEEKNALEGAKNIIRNNRPRLMISGYHKIEDFWEIPETIWSINENYKIYAGHAPGVSTEVEFYCVDE